MTSSLPVVMTDVGRSFDGRAVLKSDGMPLFKGLLGASRGYCAVQLQGNARPARVQGPSPLAQLQARSKLNT